MIRYELCHGSTRQSNLWMKYFNLTISISHRLYYNLFVYCLYNTDSNTKAQENATAAEDTSNLETETSDVEKRKSREKRGRDRLITGQQLS